ncbi:MAG: hypothetical protein Q8Q25_02325 [bacterium]|nr:hypothetical protein [bacterium]
MKKLILALSIASALLSAVPAQAFCGCGCPERVRKERKCGFDCNRKPKVKRSRCGGCISFCNSKNNDRNHSMVEEETGELAPEPVNGGNNY